MPARARIRRDGPTAHVQALVLPEQLGEVGVVRSRVAGGGEAHHGRGDVGRDGVVRTAPAVAVLQRRDSARAVGGEEPPRVSLADAQDLCCSAASWRLISWIWAPSARVLSANASLTAAQLQACGRAALLGVDQAVAPRCACGRRGAVQSCVMLSRAAARGSGAMASTESASGCVRSAKARSAAGKYCSSAFPEAVALARAVPGRAAAGRGRGCARRRPRRCRRRPRGGCGGRCGRGRRAAWRRRRRTWRPRRGGDHGSATPSAG